LETTSRTNLYAIVSVLREGSDVHDILSRQTRVEVNMSNQVDIKDVLRHRLVEPDSVDMHAVEALVNEYIEAYDGTDYVDMPDGLREEMEQTYPFHPELIESLKTRYFAETESGATRGMLYLFAKVLVDKYQETDLITHGEVDAVDYNDELTRINVEHARPDRCYDDIVERLSNTDIDFGRPILSTVLIYSLTPGLDEGATTSDIIIGTYHAGDRINDIIVDLERLQGEVYHLWRSDDRFVIREDENPRSLVKNAARDVDDTDAMQLIGDSVESLFGSGAYAVGFNTDGELESVPDSQNIKVVVKNGPWSEEEVGEIIKNQPAGRQWRNTLVFVQPRNENTISTTEQQEKFLGQAKKVIGAKLRKDDPNLSEEIQSEIADLHDEYGDELENRLEGAYGSVVDGDNLLTNFGDSAALSLDNFVAAEDELSARNIAAEAEADPFDLQRNVWGIVKDRLNSRSETTIDDVFEQFLMDPTYPIPGSVQAVITAVENGLEDQPVLAHDGTGFQSELENLDTDTVLVLSDNVEQWTVDDIEAELQRSFSGDTKEVDVGTFELDVLGRTDVWINSDDPHDDVMRAVGRLANEDQYVLVSGSDVITKARSDATLRDVSEADRLSADDVQERLRDAIKAAGEADTGQVLTAIRSDTAVHLTPDDTGAAFKVAIGSLLSDGHRIRTNGDYVGSLGDRDALSVVIVPMVPDEVGEKILEYIGDLEQEANFDLSEIQSNCAPGESEVAVRHFLLANLGDDKPEYEIGAIGSKDPTEWFPSAGFRVPAVDDWVFKYQGDSLDDLLSKWQREHESGTVSYGSLSFTTQGDDAAPEKMKEVATFEEARTDLQLSIGQSHETVADLLEKIPTSAANIDIKIEFE